MMDQEEAAQAVECLIGSEMDQYSVIVHWCPNCNEQLSTHLQRIKDTSCPYLLRCGTCNHEWWNGSDR